MRTALLEYYSAALRELLNKTPQACRLLILSCVNKGFMLCYQQTSLTSIGRPAWLETAVPLVNKSHIPSLLKNNPYLLRAKKGVPKYIENSLTLSRLLIKVPMILF